METVELFTRQHINSIYEIKNKGFMTNKEVYVRLHMGKDANYFIERYKNFMTLAEKRLPKPKYADFPIWTSISKNNCLKPVPNSLVYCLTVPKEEVIYFDGMKWDYVLNYLYIPIDTEDAESHKAELDRLGIESEHYIINGKYKGWFPQLEQKIRVSWDRIFTIDTWNDFNVQANLWQIKKEWITRILYVGDNIFEESDPNLTFDQIYENIKERTIVQ